MNPDKMREGFVNCLEQINAAKDLLDGAEGMTSFTVSVTETDIEEHELDLRRFIFFCNGIHYEISEFVDTPFSVKMGSLAEEVIDLNPSDYTYVKSKILFINNYVSLTDLVYSTIEDPSLKESFRDLYWELDEDTVSFELQLSIEEANFWQDQFDMAEQIDEATDEFFTLELREQWPNLTEAERLEYIEEFKNILGTIYGGGENIVAREVELTDEGYGFASYSNYIAVNSQFVTNPEGMYSLDKLIDTMTHEMRHRYQDINDTNFELSQTVRMGWQEEYISSDDDYDAYYRQPVETDAKAFAALAQDDEW